VPAHVLGAGGTTPPSNKITVGVLGTGDQGRADLGNFLRQKDVRVTAICDINQRNVEKARALIKEHYGTPDVKLYADFQELNRDPSIDAVQMTLPVHWHSISALDAILQKKHIFHEKPMAMSVEEIRRVRAAVHKTGVVFQLGTQQRSDLYFRWACELALNGRLGKLKEIHVSVPGGRQSELLPEQPLPDYVDWDRWMGPARTPPFHENKLDRGWHENMTNFSLGFIACWGIHHLDIAQWGNGTDDTGPCTVEGTGQFPKEGTCDAILSWRVKFEYEHATPVTFVNDGTEGFSHGIRFVGESGWAHVLRGALNLHNPDVLRDPQNKCGTMPIKLQVSNDHTRNFVDAIRNGNRAICDIDTAVRSDTLCQIALIAVKLGRKLAWDPKTERFVGDDAANGMLQPGACRGDLKLQDV